MRERAPGARVRAAAAHAVAAVVRGQSQEDALNCAPELEPRDRPLLRALVSGALRWHQRLDWQLGELLAKPLARKELVLAALIRVGLLQLQLLRIPDHAAVAATVEAADLIGRRRARGLVNAVLRRFLRDRASLDREMQGLPVPLYSHPLWLIEAIRADWPDRADAILAANNAPAPMWLRVNVLRARTESYREALAREGIACSAHEGLPQALLLEEPRAAANLPGFCEGLVSIQDGAAQYAMELLAVRSGQRVLDACAAPGGKTAHILECCPDVAEVVALDKDAERLATAEANFERLGVRASLLCADAGEPGQWWDGKPFDRILLDAPCTATGVIRRHPDIKLLRRPDDVAEACREQARLLRALWPLVAPSGRLIYATCSVLACENAKQVHSFLGATREASLALCEHPATGQRWPGEANMDGFYYACIDRTLDR